MGAPNMGSLATPLSADEVERLRVNLGEARVRSGPAHAPLCQHAAMPCHHRRVAAFVALLWPLVAALAAPPLPQRNLVVEMRIVEDAQTVQQGAQVTLGSTARGEVAGAVTLRAGSRQQGIDTTQRVLVLNGSHATLRLSQSLPVDNTEVAWTPWGPAGVVRSQWVELVNGIDVAPRWPGGNAAATVDIAAQRAATGTTVRQADVAAQWSVVSTVQVPLGEWVDVAQIGERQASVGRNGFDAATASRQRSLQLRVSLP